MSADSSISPPTADERVARDCNDCGASASLRHSSDGEVSWVRCSGCGADGSLEYRDDLAILHWNNGKRRISPSPAPALGGHSSLDRRARDILAAEYHRIGDTLNANRIRSHTYVCEEVDVALQALRTTLSNTVGPAPASEGLLRKAASLIHRIEAAGALEYEGNNFDRWKATARDLGPRIRQALETTGVSIEDDCPFVPGPTWYVEEDECWTSEVQFVGGHFTVATVHGASEAQAIDRCNAVLRALASLPQDGRAEG